MSVLLLTVLGGIFSLGVASYQMDEQREADAALQRQLIQLEQQQAQVPSRPVAVARPAPQPPGVAAASPRTVAPPPKVAVRPLPVPAGALAPPVRPAVQHYRLTNGKPVPEPDAVRP